MKIFILTLFPDIFYPYLSTSIIGRAAKNNIINFEIVDLRPFGQGIHNVVDGRPYGGGVGMVLRADILAKAWTSINTQQYKKSGKKIYTILTSASGSPYNQAKANELSKLDNILLICGHYEGVDQRFIDKYIDEEISIGDYILTGGELASLVIIDSTVRLLPEVFKKTEVTLEESFSNNTQGMLEYPHYTRPETFEGISPPDILLSGNHQKIADWRKDQSKQLTSQKRPDLMTKLC